MRIADGIALDERFENFLLRFFRNTDACVTDPNRQISPAVAVEPVIDSQNDSSVSGEFNRITDQIEQDLTQPRAVQAELRHINRTINPEKKLFLLNLILKNGPNFMQQHSHIGRLRSENGLLRFQL